MTSAFPIVITGHVDHGKSTLIGRLLHDTGTLKGDRYREMAASSAAAGRVEEFAFVLDSFEEERRRGVTIDTSQIPFSTPRRSYVIIDAPGHREFLRNTLTGASYAEAAVLMVDAAEGIREQTRRHAWLLGMVGVTAVCVAVNKMDAVGYGEGRFRSIVSEAGSLLAGLSLFPAAFVPLSARTGENVARRGTAMPWYDGPSLLEALDGLPRRPIEERPFRFPVQDVYQVGGERIHVGRVESGSVRVGEAVRVFPGGEGAVVAGVRVFPPSDLQGAFFGEAVGLVLAGRAGAEAGRGAVLAGGEPPSCGTRFPATIMWFEGDYRGGGPVTIRCVTQEAPGAVILDQVYDPARPDAPVSPDRITAGEAALCTVTTERLLVSDRAASIPEMGRFVIELDRVPAGAGIFR